MEPGDLEVEFEGPLFEQEAPVENRRPADRSRVVAVEAALEERLVSMLSGLEEHLNAEDRVEAAKAVGIIFGCWRSLQPELDQQEHPFGMLREAIVESRRPRRDPGEGEEGADGGEAG
jgi:hypothetical protein